MISFKHAFIALTLGLAFTAQAHATNVSLIADGQWNEFTADDQNAFSQTMDWINPDDGSVMTYSFTVAAGSVATLTIVDGGLAGDVFSIFNNGQSIGQTSATSVVGSIYSNDFSANLTNTDYSSRVFTLGAGSYNISGKLFSTTQDFNSTNGAIKLEVAPLAAVPEESTIAMLLAGLGLIAATRRRA